MSSNLITTIRQLLVALVRIRDFAREPAPTENTERDALTLIAAIAEDAINEATDEA